MNRLTRILLRSVFTAYVGFSIFTLSNCVDDERNFSSLEKIKSTKNSLINYLSKKFDAEIYDGSSVKSQIIKNVVLDSNIVSIQKKKEKYFLKAEINVRSNKKHYAFLECSEEVINSFNKTSTNHVLIAAKIKSVDEVDILADADSISGNKSLINLGKSIILKGECLEVVENSFLEKTN